MKDEVEKMKIDANEIELEALAAFRGGDKEEGRRLQNEFVKKYHEEFDGKDHCPCKSPCRHHGNCEECVIIHRAHMEHFPKCFWNILNEKIMGLSMLSEHSIAEVLEKDEI